MNKNLGNGHPDHGLLSEELSKGLTVLRSSSIHALEHFVKHILHLNFAITLDRREEWRVTSKPISAETLGEHMVPAGLPCENLEKLVCWCAHKQPDVVKYLNGGNVV